VEKWSGAGREPAAAGLRPKPAPAEGD
jgi:hypothetical protein